MGVIKFNNLLSSDYGIIIETPPEYETPERDYDTISVPGRNGDLILNGQSYKNVTRSYNIAVGAIGGDFTAMANKASKWMHSVLGYSRLEDSYSPDYYVMAAYSEENSMQNILQNAGRATIKFNRKPQRFLKTGDNSIIITSNGSITNTTNYASTPTIIVNGTGNGAIKIGNYIITISNITNRMIINSELGEVYKDSINLNNYVSFSDRELPKLVPDNNAISFSGGVTSLEIIPRWWTI